MLVDNAKPLLIVWLPVTTKALLDETPLAPLVIRTLPKENESLIGQIPVPFYFYERLSNAKDASEDMMGFLLDSVTENIDISYPESPTANTNGNTKATVVTVRNTIQANFRVKMNTTIVSVLRFLLKRVMTNKNIATKIRFGFFWKEYVITYAKLVNYDEEPITGSDMTLLKLKLETFNYPGEEKKTDAKKSDKPKVDVKYSYPPTGAK